MAQEASVKHELMLVAYVIEQIILFTFHRYPTKINTHNKRHYL